jgi:hypothetical protein
VSARRGVRHLLHNGQVPLRRRNDQGERRPAQREALSPRDRAKGGERGFVLTIDGFALLRPGAGAIARPFVLL